jgi:putative transposase
MLTVIDGYTRRHCMAAKPRIDHTEALDALYPLFLKHGKPHYIRFNNGSEFFAHDLPAWLKKVGIKPIQIYLENPWKNGYNEHYNGILRREVLNAEWFSTIEKAQIVINIWLKPFNHIRPHQ